MIVSGGSVSAFNKNPALMNRALVRSIDLSVKQYVNGVSYDSNSVSFFSYLDGIFGAYLDTVPAIGQYETILEVTGSGGFLTNVFSHVTSGVLGQADFRITVDGEQAVVSTQVDNVYRGVLGPLLYADTTSGSVLAADPFTAIVDTRFIGLAGQEAVALSSSGMEAHFGNPQIVRSLCPNGVVRFDEGVKVELSVSVGGSAGTYTRRRGCLYVLD